MSVFVDNVASQLRIEYGKDFRVRENGKIRGLYLFVKGVGLFNSVTGTAAPNILVKLITGAAEIDGYIAEKAEPFKPKVGEKFWYIPLPHKTEKCAVYESHMDYDDRLGFYIAHSNNCFRTREEARKAKKELLEEYDEYIKETRKRIFTGYDPI